MMLEELQRRNYSTVTTRKYMAVVSDFAKHFGKSPDKLGPQRTSNLSRLSTEGMQADAWHGGQPGSSAALLFRSRAPISPDSISLFQTKPSGLHVAMPRVGPASANASPRTRFERVAANSFIQAARMYRGRDFQFGAR
jgi:hypothetical protein